MEKTRKRNFRIIIVLGILYFVLFIFPNASTRGSDNPIVFMHKDEFVTYPIVEKMLDFSPDLSTTWGRLIIYGDYHYGYPFYFFSFLSLLPLRLLQGGDFFTHPDVNIFVLRQMINVLPMILTAGVLTFVVTRFRVLWSTLFTFMFLLFIPAIVRNNMHWWHPDALMMLAIALTFLFLQLDEFRLGRFFYLAAAACGMASAIKLMGFFFFLVIPLYLLFAWANKKTPFKKVVRSAALFVGVMLLVILISNPFLFYKGPREDMLAIQTQKSDELSSGYSHEESGDYALGPQYWDWTIMVSYGDPYFVILLLVIIIISAIAEPGRHVLWLLLAWIIPIGIYLMWFVAPKPDHYLLPLMLPLYATVTVGIERMQRCFSSKVKWVRWAAYAGVILYSVVLASQVFFFTTANIAQYSKIFQPF